MPRVQIGNVSSTAGTTAGIIDRTIDKKSDIELLRFAKYSAGFQKQVWVSL